MTSDHTKTLTRADVETLVDRLLRGEPATRRLALKKLQDAIRVDGEAWHQAMHRLQHTSTATRDRVEASFRAHPTAARLWNKRIDDFLDGSDNFEAFVESAEELPQRMQAPLSWQSPAELAQRLKEKFSKALEPLLTSDDEHCRDVAERWKRESNLPDEPVAVLTSFLSHTSGLLDAPAQEVADRAVPPLKSLFDKSLSTVHDTTTLSEFFSPVRLPPDLPHWFLRVREWILERFRKGRWKLFLEDYQLRYRPAWAVIPRLEVWRDKCDAKATSVNHVRNRLRRRHAKLHEKCKGLVNEVQRLMRDIDDVLQTPLVNPREMVDHTEKLVQEIVERAEHSLSALEGETQ